MKVLILRFDAPLISFGAPMIDQRGVVQAFPALSMLVGLIGNALGWDHRGAAKLEALQDRIRYAARVDRSGEAVIDYQTVDLGQPWMDPKKAGWTTQGQIAERHGASGDTTHIRHRHYRADSLVTAAVALADEAQPTIDQIAGALQYPARPLFLGRKCCLPASPIFRQIVDAPSLMAALSTVPRDAQRSENGPLRAWWWEGDDATGAARTSHLIAVTDERAWADQVHVGRRFMREGLVDPPAGSHG